MKFTTILEVFATVATALGGYEGVKWLISFFAHRKEEKQIKGAEASKALSEAGKSKVAEEKALRDMYEETLSDMRQEFKERLAEVRQENKERITELRQENAELHKTNLELLKAGAHKDEIIEDKVSRIRELTEQLVEKTRKIGILEKAISFYKSWHCKREYGKVGEKCARRLPEQNPPLKYIPIEDD